MPRFPVWTCPRCQRRNIMRDPWCGYCRADRPATNDNSETRPVMRFVFGGAK